MDRSSDELLQALKWFNEVTSAKMQNAEEVMKVVKGLLGESIPRRRNNLIISNISTLNDIEEKVVANP
jgi:protein-arginine kinase